MRKSNSLAYASFLDSSWIGLSFGANEEVTTRTTTLTLLAESTLISSKAHTRELEAHCLKGRIDLSLLSARRSKMTTSLTTLNVHMEI